MRDAKHPTGKDGNHRRFKYTPEAWALVEAQPKTAERIFPYDPNSIGAAFTRACRLLGIQDLRFHDLRHSAATYLAMLGATEQQLRAIGGWKSGIVSRYVHIAAADARDAMEKLANKLHPKPEGGSHA